jgi:hypothetical protein
MTQTNKDTLLIGDQKSLYFESRIPKGDTYKFVNPGKSIVDGVELIGTPKTDTLSYNNGVYELRTSVIVTSFDSGSYTLPPFKAIHILKDGREDTLYFEGATLEYSTIQIDTASFKPFEIKEQLNYPFSIKETFPWLGLLAVLLILIYAIKYLINKYSKRSREIITPPQSVDIITSSLTKLEELKNERTWLKDQKLYYTQLTDILREYIEVKYGIYAMEMTSAQIINHLATVIEKDVFFKDFEQMFSLADLIKFAKHSATESESENSIEIAVRFINKTKDWR